MDTTLDTIKGVIDANTIVGDPIRNNNTIVVPISKITIGFGIGGGEYSKGYDKKETNTNQEPGFAGGSGAAISVQPVAFVVVENEETRLMSLDHNINMIDTVLNITPKVIEKLQNMKKGKQTEENVQCDIQTTDAEDINHDIR
jgi:sporulation protein YtfJ